MLELITTDTVLEYTKAIREFMDTGQTVAAGFMIDLLEDIINGSDDDSLDDINEDEDIDDGDIFDPDMVNDHCDYCGSDGMETFGVINSDFSACSACMENHFELVG